MNPGETRPLSPAWDRALALLLLLPAAALAWPGPGALVADDLYPELAGAATTALLLLPAGALLLIRRAAPRPLGFLLLAGFVLAGQVSLAVEPPTDTLEASRATMIALSGVVALLGGATLGEAGRAWLARGLVLLSLLLVVPALFNASPELTGAVLELAGEVIAQAYWRLGFDRVALGNTGSTSEAALPGAIAGAWLLARGRGPWAFVGGLAAALQAVYAGLAPVIAGGICLMVVLGAGITFGKGRARLALLFACCAALFAGAWLLRQPAPAPQEPTAAERHPDLGGFEVRRRIWARVPRMVLDYGLLGTGPGQFAAAFPPYRDPIEARLSDEPLSGQESEVEHAHNDWLQGVSDTGPVGGALWIAFLAVAGARALRRLGAETQRAALAAAGLAVLANALVRSPLLWNPAAAPLAFAALGTVLARAPDPRRRALPARALAFVALAALVLQVPRARALIEHGAALSAPARRDDPTQLARALAACPDSVHARTLAARIEEANEARGPAIEEWRRVLALRPHRYEALVQLGKLHARAGRDGEAIRLWTRARALRPDSPVVARNLMRVHGMVGDVEAAAGWAERGGVDPSQLARLGFDVLRLRADTDAAFELMARGDGAFEGLTAQRCWDLAEAPPAGYEGQARSLRGAAHLLWARQQAAQGERAAAVRSYRLARDRLSYRLPQVEEPQLAAPLRLELAAALLLTGREDEARRVAAGDPRPTARQLARLPAWAGDALLAAGLLGSP